MLIKFPMLHSSSSSYRNSSNCCSCNSKNYSCATNLGFEPGPSASWTPIGGSIPGLWLHDRSVKSPKPSFCAEFKMFSARWNCEEKNNRWVRKFSSRKKNNSFVERVKIILYIQDKWKGNILWKKIEESTDRK